MSVKKENFLLQYLRSARLYYCFVSGAATFAGTAVAHGLYGSFWSFRDAVIIFCGFAAWGINQIFNDYFDLEADKLNAPHRPMAAGKLSIPGALTLSTVLMVLLGACSLLISPVTLYAALAGGVLNLLYSKLKKIPLLNCLLYGFSLSCCTWYGFAGSCGANTQRALSKEALITTCTFVPIHFFMCSLSYYKDKKGDRAAGVYTLQNLLPDFITLPLHFAAMLWLMFLFFRTITDRAVVLLCAVVMLSLFLELFYFLCKKEYHLATKVNCQFCVVWLLSVAGAMKSDFCLLILPVLAAVELLYNWNGSDSKRFVTGFEKLLFYAGMSLRCAVHLKSFSALWKAGIFTKVFFCHKLLQLPTGEYKLDFYMPRYPSEAFFTAMQDKLLCTPPRPVSVVWSITKACRYRCPHCYQGFDPSEEMPLDTMRHAARELRNSGVAAWAVEGGEVLLRFERLTALLEELKGLEVWVNSTGDGATPEKVLRLKELEVTGVMSSLHAVSPEKHDAFTGRPGSFRTACGFLEMCRNAGLLTGFNTVLTDEEIIDGGIDRIMGLAAENMCDYVQLIHPKSCGRWGREKFDHSSHEKAVRIACEAQKRYNSRKEKNAPILTAQVFEESPEMLGCTAGAIDRFYVGCSGEVQPCEFVNISFGNLCDTPYSVIYERMRRTFPVPCCEWLCCKYSSEIADAVARNGGKTPLPWAETEQLVRRWSFNTPTPVYQKMGIYK